MSRRFQIILITLACVAAYFVLRSLPVEKCEFLHYGDYVNSEGVIEGCGYEETEFFVMEDIRFPVIATLTPLSEPQPGELTQFELTLYTTTGRPIEWDAVAISHTERIHAMVIDASLEDYHHVHPKPAGAPGHYLMELAPQRTGPYSVYLDFIPLVSSRRTLVETGFTVEGPPGVSKPAKRLDYHVGSLSCSFRPMQSKLQVGEELTFELDVHADDGQPVTFTPVMDSFAHVVAFDEGKTGFAHMHPRNPFIEGQDPTNPDLEFTFLFDRAGYYRVWAQVIANGDHLFLPFDLIIGDGA